MVVAQNFTRQVDTPTWNCSHGNCSKTALRACSSSWLEKVSSLSLVFLLSSDDPGPWDPRDTVAVEPSLCPIPRACRTGTARGGSCAFFNLAYACREGDDVLFHFCECGHLGRKGTNDLFNDGNPGCEKDTRSWRWSGCGFRNWQHSVRVVTTYLGAL